MRNEKIPNSPLFACMVVGNPCWDCAPVCTCVWGVVVMTVYFWDENWEEFAVDVTSNDIAFDGHYAYFKGENHDTNRIPVTSICEIYGG